MLRYWLKRRRALLSHTQARLLKGLITLKGNNYV